MGPRQRRERDRLSAARPPQRYCGGFRLNVTVPPNTRALVQVPGCGCLAGPDAGTVFADETLRPCPGLIHRILMTGISTPSGGAQQEDRDSDALFQTQLSS